MTPERWQQIDLLFEAALELEPGQWTAFLAQNCAGDDELQREVESLLAAHEQSASFIEEPPVQAAAELLGTDRTESFVGQQIGRYKILELLGKGGMGEVYSAWDSRLGRKIALKLLPTYFAQDRDRLRRFEQEAHAASSLNHPNILTIHEIEQVDGQPFIVTEFIDGETLRESMVGAPMNLSEKLDIAIQVVGALAAAHEAGIVHRDIKPENIMLRRDGYLKVLDFGIAKLTEGGDVDVAAVSGPTTKTDTGVVIGTATYMSPEQARGLAVDARTDIWSLGVVLYEIVTGKVPFEGATNSDVIVSVLEREPTPLLALSAGTPAELQRIVGEALMKDREGRYQTAKELLVDLRRLKQRLESEAETAGELAKRIADVQALHTTSNTADLVGKIKLHKRGAILIAAMLVMTVSGVALALYKYLAGDRSQHPPAAPFQRMKITRLTTSGKAVSATISPDGKYVAYTVTEPDSILGQQSLWVRQVSTGRDMQIIPPAEFWYEALTFSRDGNYIHYIKGKWGKDAALYELPVLGGVARKLRDVPGIGTGDFILSPDGKRLAFVQEHPGGESTLMVASALDAAGEQRLATHKRPDLIRYPMWSPDGEMISYAVLSAEAAGVRLVEVRVADGAERPVTSQRWKYVRPGARLPDGSGLVLPASDQIYDSYQLWHISYPGGEVRRITNDINNYCGVTPTADSTALVTMQRNETSYVWIVPNGVAGRARKIISDAGKTNDYWGFSWTPDGKIVYESTASGNQDLWIMDQDGGHQKQLTVDAGGNFDPSVTPDGRYIVFTSNRLGATNIWRMDIDGGNPKQLTKGVRDFVPQCSPIGRWVVYTAGDPARLTLWKVPIDGGDPAQLTDYFSQWPSVSPDGKMIACWYFDEKANLVRLAVIPFEGGEPIKIFDIGPTVNTWAEVRWTLDGRALTYSNSRDILSQPLTGGPPKPVTAFKADQLYRFEWSRDGKQLLTARGVLTQDVVMISDFR